MDDPDGEIFEPRRVGSGSRSAEDDHGGEARGVFHCETVGSVAAPAHSGEVELGVIVVDLLVQFIKEAGEAVFVPESFFVRVERRNDDHGEVPTLGDFFGRPVHFDLVQVVAAFASAVEEEKERRLCDFFRLVEKVVNALSSREGELTWFGGGELDEQK